jgi:sugar transferase (PEP-CTERM/EpsH1 system associated)
MQDLLFLAHRIPYPPNKGDKIRSWNILRHLAARHRVHLGCFVDDPDDWRHLDTVREICGECHFEALDPTKAKIKSLTSLVRREPMTLGYYRNQAMNAWVSDINRRHDVQGVFVFSSSMAQYAIDGRFGSAPVVIDFVDVDSDKWAQYARKKAIPEKWIYAREARTLGAYERHAASLAKANIFVSEAEAALFRSLAPDSADKTFGINNGVDFDFFNPDTEYPDPFEGARDALVFTGAMDYWANAEAVGWFARDVLPRIRERCATARFWIVGSNPSPEVQKLASLPGVTVTGRVPDVRPFIAHAAAVVAPLRVARGIQNKVLEAMAMAKAVVATPQALDGIDAEPGRDLVVASEPEPFAESVAELVNGTGRGDMGQRARERVKAGYGWQSNLSALNAILERPGV